MLKPSWTFLDHPDVILIFSFCASWELSAWLKDRVPRTLNRLALLPTCGLLLPGCLGRSIGSFHESRLNDEGDEEEDSLHVDESWGVMTSYIYCFCDSCSFSFQSQHHGISIRSEARKVKRLLSYWWHHFDIFWLTCVDVYWFVMIFYWPIDWSSCPFPGLRRLGCLAFPSRAAWQTRFTPGAFFLRRNQMKSIQAWYGHLKKGEPLEFLYSIYHSFSRHLTAAFFTGSTPLFS